jgi:cleavage stimulation factor subunit 2
MRDILFHKNHQTRTASAGGLCRSELCGEREIRNLEMGDKHDVFVGNLSYNTTAENLMEIFSKVGTVAGVRVVSDKDTGRPRGFAFIEYDDAATALSAIRNLDGYDFGGRKVIDLSRKSHPHSFV